MENEHPDPADLAALRAAFAPGPAAAGPALGWHAVRAFEAEHGVVLPEPYRTCVAEIADGWPAGPPEYGLLPLAALPSDWGDDGSARTLRRPFPLTNAWLWEEDPRPAAEVDPLVDRVVEDGSVVLGTDGCGMNWHLVITGAHRGQVWMISGEGAVPFGAEFGLTTGDAGFAGWVGHWAADEEWFDAA
ncbi:SMI1/KNR4 family protein [Streptomyces sp. NPDC058000]|uniref:SMI1/KNR4 family protein n=1 Tax=Streptomyces sp. NPDC058000 TaxID=3346299 RepID=UPI0036EC6E0D